MIVVCGRRLLAINTGYAAVRQNFRQRQLGAGHLNGATSYSLAVSAPAGTWLL